MIKSAIFGLLLAGSTAGYSQTTTQPTTDPLSPTTTATTTQTTATPTTTTTTPSGTTPAIPAQPASPADPATGTPATPATSATPATPATPADTATQPATEPAAPTDAAGIVAADFSKYDKNSNKQLSRTEFTKWVTDLQTASGNKAPTRTYLSGAFTTADKNKSGSVSQEELVAFLSS
jgi:hypothetical protein